jgi:hypothetical protein
MQRFVKTRFLVLFFEFFSLTILSHVSAQNESLSLPQNQVLFHLNFDQLENLQDLSFFKHETKLRYASFKSKKNKISAWVPGQWGYGFRTSAEIGGIETLIPKMLPDAPVFSLLFWMKPETFTAEQFLAKIVSPKLKNTLLLSIKNGVLEAAFLTSEGSPATVKAPLTLKTWQHITLIFDTSKEKMILYHNAEKVDTTTITPPKNSQKPFEKQNEREITIGFENKSYFFDGVFDEWTLIDGALSAAQISDWSQRTIQAGQAGQAGGHADGTRFSESQKEVEEKKMDREIYLPMNQISDTHLDSYVVGTTLGKLSGDGFYWSKGIKAGALTWSQKGDRIDIERYPAHTFQNSFTVTLWIKPKSFGEKRKLLSTFNPENPDTFLILGLDNKQMYALIGHQSKQDIIKSPQECQVNTWQHLALVFNKDREVIELYQNGAKAASIQLTITPPILQFPLTLGAGSLVGPLGNSDSFHGTMDEVKAYSKALSISEIAKDTLQDSDPKKLYCDLNFNQDFPLWVHDLSPANHRAQIHFPILSAPDSKASSSLTERFGSAERTSFFSEGQTGAGFTCKKESGTLVLPSSHYFDNLEEFTLSVWLKPHSFGEKRKIFSRVQIQKPNAFLILGEDNGFLYFAIGDPRKHHFSKLKKPLLQHFWQHVAVSYHQKKSSVLFYLNGTLVLEEKTLHPFPIVSYVETTLGSDYQGLESFWNGVMDDFKFFASTLKQEDILTLISSTSPLLKTPPSLPIISKKKEENHTTSPDSPDSPRTPPFVETKKTTEMIPTSTQEAFPPQETDLPKNNSPLLLEILRKQYQDWHLTQSPENVSTLSLKKISFFKQNQLFAHFRFEGKGALAFQDDLLSPVECYTEPKNPPSVLLGSQGTGLFVDTEVRFSPIKLTIPRLFTVQFDFFPLNLLKQSESTPLLRFLTTDSKEIVHFALIEDSLSLVLPDVGSELETQVMLMTQGWQKILISYDSEEKAFTIHKNGAFLKKIPFETLMPSNFILAFGKNGATNNIPFVLDNVLLYRHAFRDSFSLPEESKKKFVTLKEGPIVYTPELTLLLYSDNAIEVAVSTDADFIDTKWVPFQSELTIPATLVTGPHVLYCKFRNKTLMESDPIAVQYQWIGQSKEIQFTNPISESTIAGNR